jgi:DNA polymerase-3 subunit delta'
LELDNLQILLYKKYLEQKLASLYIANYDSQSIDPNIWVEDFVKQFSKIEDHPDILKVYKTEKETEYKVDSASIKNFLKFLNYNPIKLINKFIFIFDAQDLSVILSNKLLKVFEELDPKFCIILMIPDNAQMLPTVLSRAIKLQVTKSKSNQTSNTLFDVSAIKTPSELGNALKQSQGNPYLDEKKFIEQAITKTLEMTQHSPESVNKLSELLSELKNYEIAQSFNNSKLSRLAPFFP